MTTLVVVAASGLAREALAVPGALDPYDRVVLLDDDPARWGDTVGGHPVLEGGTDRLALDSWLRRGRVLVCAGSGTARRDLVGRLGLAGHGDRSATVRHPSVDVPAGCTVGAGSILLAGVVLTADVTVGQHVVAMPGAVLTHDVVVEDYATLCAGVRLGGAVVVGEAAYLGMGCSVRERTTVGREAVLGMGAVLLQDLPAGRTWVGVPARPVGQGTGTDRARGRPRPTATDDPSHDLATTDTATERTTA